MIEQVRWIGVNGRESRLFGDTADPGIVLLNGSAARGWYESNAYLWEPVFDRLNRVVSTVALELIGHGRTGGPSLVGASLETQLAHLEAWLETLPRRPRHLVGHDEGALVALLLARRRPDLVAGLTLVAARALVPLGDGLPDLTLAGRLHPPLGRAGQRWVLEQLSHSPAHIEQGQFLAEAVAIAEEREAGDAAAEQAARDRLLREQAAAKARIFADLRDIGLPMPVMLVWGGNDRAASLAYGLALFGQIRLRTPLARLHVINRAGAFPFREQPAAFVSALTAQVAPDIPQPTDTNNR